MPVFLFRINESEHLFDGQDVLAVFTFVSDLTHGFFYDVDAKTSHLSLRCRQPGIGVGGPQRVIRNATVNEATDNEEGLRTTSPQTVVLQISVASVTPSA